MHHIGSNCNDIDWTGQSDWYKRYFIDLQPLQVTNSLGAPSVPKHMQTLTNTTSSVFYCPSRDFKYICQLVRLCTTISSWAPTPQKTGQAIL